MIVSEQLYDPHRSLMQGNFPILEIPTLKGDKKIDTVTPLGGLQKERALSKML